MEQKIKKQMGFIQIPILIVIIASVVATVIVAGGVVLYKQGKISFTENISDLTNKNEVASTPIGDNQAEIEIDEDVANNIEETNKQKETEKQEVQKSVEQQQINNQTDQYKKSLMSRIVNSYALATTKGKYVGQLMTIIDDRINSLNSQISANESMANYFTLEIIRERVLGLNGFYNLDIKYSQSTKGVIGVAKGFFDALAKYLSDDATKISQMNSISANQFKITNNDLNNAEKGLSDFSTNLENTISEYSSEVAKDSQFYKNYLEETRIGIEYLLANYGGSSSEINYYSPSTYVPLYIPPIQSTTCYFRFYGTSGSMECY